MFDFEFIIVECYNRKEIVGEKIRSCCLIIWSRFML